MSRVTSKRQVTIPKQLADQYRIETGDEISWVAEGDAIRVVVGPSTISDAPTVEERLELFDRATERQRRRRGVARSKKGQDRGWTREELYDRGRPR